MSYKNFAIDLARQAGAYIRSNFSSFVPSQWKNDNSPVTEIDVRINNLVTKTIRATFPDHTIISEEGSDAIPGSRWAWVCDPIDGTLAFMHGIPACTFSLALIDQGISVLGVIYDPILDKLYYAEKNGGAWLNDVQINVSTTGHIERALIGMPMWRGFKYPSLPIAKEIHDAGGFLINTCAIAHMGSLVASGQIDTAVYLDTSAHDVAALKVIVEEAGGLVTDLFGKDQRYDQNVRGCIISNKLLHNDLIGIINKTIGVS